MLPVLAATARRQGSQLAAKNSANSALPWLTPVNPSVTEIAYLGPARFCTPRWLTRRPHGTRAPGAAGPGKEGPLAWPRTVAGI